MTAGALRPVRSQHPLLGRRFGDRPASRPAWPASRRHVPGEV